MRRFTTEGLTCAQVEQRQGCLQANQSTTSSLRHATASTDRPSDTLLLTIAMVLLSKASPSQFDTVLDRAIVSSVWKSSRLWLMSSLSDGPDSIQEICLPSAHRRLDRNITTSLLVEILEFTTAIMCTTLSRSLQEQPIHHHSL